ncbi:MAG: hypothetical protein GY882_01530 [Actinomycetia bacterium]|nr:hypothetical protein [Actinomycetes bacterium]
MTTALMLFGIAAVVALIVTKLAEKADAVEQDDRISAWERAAADNQNLVGRTMVSVARPLTRLQSLVEVYESRPFRAISTRLLTADLFGGDVAVFLAVQTVAVYFGTVGFGVAFFAADSLTRIVAALAGAIVAYYPWSLVKTRSDKRHDAVNDQLPHFADLLLIPVSAGKGVIEALAFTAERADGPVADEVETLLATIRARPAETREAFVATGDRLGTAEARAFMSTLEQAHTRGHAMGEMLAAQATSLRIAAYQRRRAVIKKVPSKLVVTFALHIVPFILTLTFLPAMLALGGGLS